MPLQLQFLERLLERTPPPRDGATRSHRAITCSIVSTTATLATHTLTHTGAHPTEARTNMSTGTFDANKAQNLPEIEKQMAVRCVEHAQTYWNLLEKIKPSSLRLTK